MKFNNSGYTLVELIITVVALGIITTIGIVSYSGWNQSLIENKLKSDLSSVYAAMESVRTFNNNYPSDVNSLSNLKPSPDVVLTGGSIGDGKTYCVTASITKNSKVIYYHIDSTNTGHTAQPGACNAEFSINVIENGVKGDGVTDDTTKLLEVFNKAISQSKVAYIPSGTYYIENSLTLPENVSIIGDGKTTWIKGRVLLNSGDTISNLAIGIDGSTTQLTTNSPVTNLTMKKVIFKGGSTNGVFRVGYKQSLSNSNFTDCVIETNSDGLSNGISIEDNGVVNSTLHDVTFTRLHIMSQPRMGFEMIGREYLGPRTTNYYNINIVDSIIEPVGAEAISFDGPGSNLLVQDTHFKGSLNSTQYSWHQMLEFNGSSNSKAIGNTFDRAKGWWLNLHCTDCSFENNNFDSRIDNVGIISNVQAWGGGCTDCTFKNNNVTMDSGEGFLYFTNSTGNLFTENTFWDTRNPTTKCSYFQEGSSGNTMTGNTFKYQYRWYPDNNLCINISADSSVNVNNNILLSP